MQRPPLVPPPLQFTHACHLLLPPVRVALPPSPPAPPRGGGRLMARVHFWSSLALLLHVGGRLGLPRQLGGRLAQDLRLFRRVSLEARRQCEAALGRMRRELARPLTRAEHDAVLARQPDPLRRWVLDSGPGVCRGLDCVDYVCRSLAVMEDHDFYERALRIVDPDLRLHTDVPGGMKRFVGRGVGPENLNCYRAVGTSAAELFEKIYYRDARALVSLRAFERHVRPRLVGRPAVRAPALESWREGAVAVAVYVDFVDTRPLPRKRFLAKADQVARLLERVGLEPAVAAACGQLRPYAWQSLCRDLRICRKTGLEAACRDGLLPAVERALGDLPHFLGHGDLNPGNLLLEAIVDWDGCGYYPIGHEYARIMMSQPLLADVSGYGDLLWTLTAGRHAEVWDAFLLAFHYFFLLYLASGERRDVPPGYYAQLSEALRRSYQAVRPEPTG